jgi:Nuclease-related domain
VPGRRANIDHIAFAPSGVYVIDTKRYRGRIAAPAGARLVIDRRDETALIGKLQRQLDAVQAALSSIGEDVPLHGCLCFVAPAGFLAEAKLPALRTLRVSGIPLYNARRLTRHLNRPGPVAPERALRLHAELALRLPAAG